MPTPEEQAATILWNSPSMMNLRDLGKKVSEQLTKIIDKNTSEETFVACCSEVLVETGMELHRAIILSCAIYQLLIQNRIKTVVE